MKISTILMIAAFGLSSPAAAATLLTNDEGQLTGATGVDIRGSLFDVSFANGTCVEIFEGCDEQSDFLFEGRQQSFDAALALRDQVFVGIFGDDPALTATCDLSDPCYFYTPFGFNSGGIDSSYYGNIRNFPGTIAFNTALQKSYNFSSNINRSYAVFSPTNLTGAVPEPSTWAMMLFGFGLMGGFMRSARRKQNMTVGYA